MYRLQQNAPTYQHCSQLIFLRFDETMKFVAPSLSLFGIICIVKFPNIATT